MFSQCDGFPTGIHTLHFTLHTPHSTLSTPHSTLYTFDSTLQIGNRGDMYKTVQINYCRKVLCVTAYPCVSTSVPLTYVWAFGFVGYYFVLQSLHKVVPSTTLYYKACTKHFPVLLCTTKLAQSTFQYYFVLQSLHKAIPSTTLYYKACAKHSQYDFVLQSWHSDARGQAETRDETEVLQLPQRHGDARGEAETEVS